MVTSSGPGQVAWSSLKPLDDIQQARAGGVSWTELGLTSRGPVNLAQVRSARKFLQFRSGFTPDEDQETARRAARVLRAGPAAELREKVLGLPADPGDPAAADFSDVAAGLDQWAEDIHRRAAPARHARPRD